MKDCFRRHAVHALFRVLLVIALISCNDDSLSPDHATKRSEKVITSFKLAALNPEVTGIINEAQKTITLHVPEDTDVTSLVPTITVSEKATVSPASGLATNFYETVIYTVTAEDGSKQTYSVTVLTPMICVPTKLPVTQEQFDVKYYSDNSILSIGSENYYNDYEYDLLSGHFSHISYFNNGATTTGIDFQYHPDKIIARNTYMSSYDDSYYVYYLEGGKITSYVYVADDALQDSIAYVYDDKENITHAHRYNENKNKTDYTEYEYDDKINPYKGTGVTYSSLRPVVFKPENISPNNVVKVTKYNATSDEKTEEKIFNYTYNEFGFPVTLAIDNMDEKSFEYNCARRK